jgi:hypothetical protein
VALSGNQKDVAAFGRKPHFCFLDRIYVAEVKEEKFAALCRVAATPSFCDSMFGVRR